MLNWTNLTYRFRHKASYLFLTSLTSFTLFFANLGILPSINSEALADSINSQAFRLAGISRYETAIKISQAGWGSAQTVVLARGDNFPDALAGAVLANSPQVNGPLLLTESNTLTTGVLDELKRLKAQKIYILGGPGAVSSQVENTLKATYPFVQRLSGADRYETAAKIALEAVSQAGEVFLASGEAFADALSISSYAASKGIPLLLTDKDQVPAATLDALKKLGVGTVTLIGGEGVISPKVKSQLEGQNYTVKRLSGTDRYATNLDILNKLNYDTTSVYVATGEDFPDALAGAVLAAKRNNPILLVPKADLSSATMTYLNTRRTQGASFTLLGGWGVISYGVESIIRTGSLHPRISLHYLQGYGSSAYTAYLNQLSLIPGQATDYVDFVSPNWYSLNEIPSGQAVADGSITGPWEQNSLNYAQIINTAHARGLKVLPLVASSWSSAGKAALDSVLKNQTSRQNLVKQIVSMLQTTGADGVVIDFEYMSDETGPYLTQFMQELYPVLRAQNKVVVQAVMPRTSSTDWYPEFNYRDLSPYVDYLHIMTYDYSTSVPGPIAPLGWVKKVLDFTKSAGVDLHKVLLGLPYYGRDWKQTDSSSYSKSSVSLSGAINLANDYKITPQRETTPDDPLGIPYLSYTDTENKLHKVYYDDVPSWEAKLGLLDSYNLGGIGAWSLYWVNAETAKELFPLLYRHLR